MKRLGIFSALALALALAPCGRADWPCTYGGYQPWWNMIAHRDKSQCRDQARLQRFWHDYYYNLKLYYGMMENMDWVSYYKHHGTPIGSVQGRCGGPASIQMAPLEIAPVVPWDLTRNSRAPWAPRDVPWGHHH